MPAAESADDSARREVLALEDPWVALAEQMVSVKQPKKPAGE